MHACRACRPRCGMQDASAAPPPAAAAGGRGTLPPPPTKPSAKPALQSSLAPIHPRAPLQGREAMLRCQRSRAKRSLHAQTRVPTPLPAFFSVAAPIATRRQCGPPRYWPGPPCSWRWCAPPAPPPPPASSSTARSTRRAAPDPARRPPRVRVRSYRGTCGHGRWAVRRATRRAPHPLLFCPNPLLCRPADRDARQRR